jgi:hypothetical protein
MPAAQKKTMASRRLMNTAALFDIFFDRVSMRKAVPTCCHGCCRRIPMMQLWMLFSIYPSQTDVLMTVHHLAIP